MRDHKRLAEILNFQGWAEHEAYVSENAFSWTKNLQTLETDRTTKLPRN